MQSAALLGIVSAMKYLHGKGVLFRDLKPANIGFTRKGTAQLFDFGLARHIENCPENELAGTPRYLASELLESCAGYTYSLGSDIYSFGVLSFEVCTLARPPVPRGSQQPALKFLDGGSDSWWDPKSSSVNTNESTGSCDPVAAKHPMKPPHNPRRFDRRFNLNSIPCRATKSY